jgi:PPK2 family polyphosphate:nucleotide phosphotransferase
VKLDRAIIEELEVSPGEAANLGGRSTDSTKVEWLESPGLHRKDVADRDLASFVQELKAAQELLWASDTYALLVVLQAMDAAGKDGTIKHVMSGVNPQGCQVVAFKQPTVDELGHDFLWRYGKALPERGSIGIFNRSYYEEVLVVRVHPELLGDDHSGGPGPSRPEHLWRHRFEDINAFEHHLHRNGTRIVKIFLHVSKEVQRHRLLARLDDPAKLWKFSTADLAERAYWDEYVVAYEEAIAATSTPWAPWYVVPADHKYALRALVGGILVHAVDQMDLQPPTIGPDQAAELDRARSELLAE